MWQISKANKIALLSTDVTHSTLVLQVSLTSGNLAQLNDLSGCEGLGAFRFGCLLKPNNPPSVLPPGGGGGAGLPVSPPGGGGGGGAPPGPPGGGGGGGGAPPGGGGGGGGGATPAIGDNFAAAAALVRLEILASSGIEAPTPFNISSNLCLS